MYIFTSLHISKNSSQSETRIYNRPSDTCMRGAYEKDRRSKTAARLARFLCVLQVTTTDGEQPDDSFDLIDVPAEMSPPATAPSQPSSIHPDDITASSRNSSPASPTSPISVAAPANQTTPPLPHSSSPTSPLRAFDGTETAGPSGRCSRSRLDSSQQHDSNSKTTSGSTIGQAHNTSNGAEGTSTALPPPTPMVSVHQESRFTFGGSGRTPPLPDLRAADFFR